MTLEKTIKFYEKNLPKKNIREIRKYVRDCYETRPDLFIKKEHYQYLYMEILIQEYLKVNCYKDARGLEKYVEKKEEQLEPWWWLTRK